jgi:hypothetical protein
VELWHIQEEDGDNHCEDDGRQEVRVPPRSMVDQRQSTGAHTHQVEPLPWKELAFCFIQVHSVYIHYDQVHKINRRRDVEDVVLGILSHTLGHLAEAKPQIREE